MAPMNFVSVVCNYLASLIRGEAHIYLLETGEARLVEARPKRVRKHFSRFAGRIVGSDAAANLKETVTGGVAKMTESAFQMGRTE